MINYKRLRYKTKRNLLNFSAKISKGLEKPKKIYSTNDL